jgi:hypothetical protein
LTSSPNKNKKKDNLGSEVLLRVEILSEDNFATIACFRYQSPPGLPGDTGLQLYAKTECGDYKGWTGLSPPAAYPSTMGNKANKGNF